MTSHEEGHPSTIGDDYQLNITEFIRSSARNLPEREIVSGTGSGQFRYTYAEAHERMKRLANALVDIGIGPGDVVGVLGWNDHRHFETFFGVPGIGATFLQLNLRIHPKTLAYVVEHSRPRYLIVDESLLELAESFVSDDDSIEGYIVLTDRDLADVETDLGPLHSYEELLVDASPEYEWPEIDENTACSICYTTGTTGKPKAVGYSHRSNYLVTMQTAQTYNISRDDTALMITPMFHIQGGGTPLAATYAGAKMVFPGRYSLEEPEPLVDLLVDENTSFASGVPLIYRTVLGQLTERYPDIDLEQARFMVGGTAPSRELILGLKEFGADLMTTYGATETTALITSSYTKPTQELTTAGEVEVRQRGLPVTGVDVRLVDPETGEEVPHDGESVGEVYVRSPWTTTGYYDDPRTDDAFTDDGYWQSGDLATIGEDGYLTVVDRLKDGIKSGGEWISSVDMETSLTEHQSVADAAVIGLDHEKWDERPFALVRTTPDGSVTAADLRSHLSEEFADWQLPDEFEFVEEIPKTSVGKNDKAALREQYKGYYLDL